MIALTLIVGAVLGGSVGFALGTFAAHDRRHDAARRADITPSLAQLRAWRRDRR